MAKEIHHDIQKLIRTFRLLAAGVISTVCFSFAKSPAFQTQEKNIIIIRNPCENLTVMIHYHILVTPLSAVLSSGSSTSLRVNGPGFRIDMLRISWRIASSWAIVSCNSLWTCKQGIMLKGVHLFNDCPITIAYGSRYNATFYDCFQIQCYFFIFIWESW